MMTTTGMTTVGMIVETIGAETTGAGNNGVASKPGAKPSAIVTGNATMIGPCVTVMRTIAATIAAKV
ncbi:hypothetical protein D3C77_740490 [compost metagenome]